VTRVVKNRGDDIGLVLASGVTIEKNHTRMHAYLWSLAYTSMQETMSKEQKLT